MKKLIAKVLKLLFSFALISAMIYFGIVTVLMITDKPKKPDQAQRGPAFDELFFDYSSLPELKRFTARDGTQLAYRHYPAECSGGAGEQSLGGYRNNRYFSFRLT